MFYNSNYRLFDRNEVDHIFAELNKAFVGPSCRSAEKQLSFDETEEGLTTTIDLPGVSPEQLQIQTQGNILSIKVASDGIMDDKAKPLSCEWTAPKLHQRLRLSDKYDSQKTQASLKYGVLTITIPKAEEARAKTINVVAA